MEFWNHPTPSGKTSQGQKGWRRKWPIITLFSAMGIVCLIGAIVWSYTAQLLKFPPDVADRAALAWPLPAVPSAVVLPISSVANTDRDTLLAGRFRDDLIDTLARVPGLFVISPETSGRFGGGQFRVKATAEALGVRYLVTGTLSRVGSKYRVFLKVIDAFSGEAEWAEDYDTEPNDLFKVPGLALAKILDVMDVEFDEEQISRITAPGPTNPDAWAAFAEAVSYRVVDDRESMANSLARLLKARALDPAWSSPAREISWTYLNAARRGWTGPEAPTIGDLVMQGVEFADELTRIDPDNAYGPARKAALLAVIHGDTDETVVLRRDAARLGPNVFAIQWDLAQALIRAGRHREALPVMKHALRVHPRHPVALTQALAELQFAAGEPDAAFASLDAVIEKRPAAEDPRLMRIFLLHALDRKADAAAQAKEFLSLHPGFSFSKWSARQGRRGRPARTEWRGALREAGLTK
jgi:adenylate cyclase